MSRYILSPAAQSDLEQIWDYTRHRWGVDQAEEYLREFSAPSNCRCESTIGRACDESAPAIASSPPGHTRCSIGSPPKRSSTSCAYCTNAWTSTATSDVLCRHHRTRPHETAIKPSRMPTNETAPGGLITNHYCGRPEPDLRLRHFCRLRRCSGRGVGYLAVVHGTADLPFHPSDCLGVTIAL